MCSDVQQPYHLPLLCSIHQDSSLKSVRINQHQLQESLCMNSASDPDSLEKPDGIEGSNLDTLECPTVVVGFFKSVSDQETKTWSWADQGYLAITYRCQDPYLHVPTWQCFCLMQFLEKWSIKITLLHHLVLDEFFFCVCLLGTWISCSMLYFQLEIVFWSSCCLVWKTWKSEPKAFF